MLKKSNYVTAWLLLFMTVGLAAVMVIIPVWLIQPFAAQTERQVEISYLLKSWSPVLTVIFVVDSNWFGNSYLEKLKTLVWQNIFNFSAFSDFYFYVVCASKSF